MEIIDVIVLGFSGAAVLYGLVRWKEPTGRYALALGLVIGLSTTPRLLASWGSSDQVALVVSVIALIVAVLVLIWQMRQLQRNSMSLKIADRSMATTTWRLATAFLVADVLLATAIGFAVGHALVVFLVAVASYIVVLPFFLRTRQPR